MAGTTFATEGRPWGAGTGVTKFEVLQGLQWAGANLDPALLGGKRHFENPIGLSPRTKLETLVGHPLSGQGADIAFAGGKRHISPERGPSDGIRAGRTKFETMEGLPLWGSGADIALAGGRRLFSSAARRCGSAPPGLEAPPCANETVRDVQVQTTAALIGRAARKSCPAGGDLCTPRGQSPRAKESPRPLPVSWSPDPVQEVVASPARRRGRGSERDIHAISRVLVRQSSVPGRLSAAALEVVSRMSVAEGSSPLARQASECTIAASDSPFYLADCGRHSWCAGPVAPSTVSTSVPSSSPVDLSPVGTGFGWSSPGSSPATASHTSLDTVLMKSLSTARTLQHMRAAMSQKSSLCSAVDNALREEMDTAWAAVCMKLNLPLHAGQATGKNKNGRTRKHCLAHKGTRHCEEPLPEYPTVDSVRFILATAPADVRGSRADSEFSTLDSACRLGGTDVLLADD